LKSACSGHIFGDSLNRLLRLVSSLAQLVMEGNASAGGLCVPIGLEAHGVPGCQMLIGCGGLGRFTCASASDISSSATEKARSSSFSLVWAARSSTCA